MAEETVTLDTLTSSFGSPPPSPYVNISVPDLGLHQAVAAADIGSIYYALMGGQPVDSKIRGLQPIHIAATQDDPTVIEILLQNGADINARTESPIVVASGAIVGTTSNASSIAPIQQKQQCLELSAETTRAENEQQSKEKKRPRKNSRSDKVKRRSGSNSSYKHGGALLMKSWHRRGSFLKENKMNNGLGPISGPVSYLADAYSMDSVEMDSGASISEDNIASDYHGATPLHFAVANGGQCCIDVLVRHHALLNVADSYGNTPESIALARGDNNVADMLNRAIVSSGKQFIAVPMPMPVDELPTPEPSDICSTEQLDSGTMAAVLLPSRRHTAGSTDCHSPNSINGSASILPATTRMSLDEINTSWMLRRSSISENKQPLVNNTAIPTKALPNNALRRERSQTDSAIEKAWRSYLENDDDSGVVSGDRWLWRQAAMAVRNRRSQSLSVNKSK